MKMKRLLAGFVAVAMTVGMTPSLVLANIIDYEPEETGVVETTEPEETKKKEG